MLWILGAHVAALPVFSLVRGFGLAASIGPVTPIMLAGFVAMREEVSRRGRSMAAVLGLLTGSAVLVNAWGGQIEAHFHFFVMIALVALYEDWLPFGLAVAYVVAEHGALGAMFPHSVYNHGGNPWAWAGVHGLFVLGAGAANVTTWRLNEDMRAKTQTAHRRAEETARTFQLVFESRVSGMALIAADGRYLSVNHALCEITGYSEDELLTRTFQSITHPDDLVGDLHQKRALLEGAKDIYEGEKRYLHRDGHEVWVQIGVSVVRGENGVEPYFIVQTKDVTARRRAQEELAYRALHDELTGLPNRALFLDRLSHALMRLRRQPSSIAVLFIDLDRFKLVNDGMGHQVGDVVLADAARRLIEASRAEDTVARFGGDEFAILCENVGGEEARVIAQRLVDAFARPFAHEGREFHLSLSVGIRVSDVASEEPDLLMRDADIALYAAKERGRGRLEVFASPSGTADIDVLATEQALRLALRNGEFCVQYQPQIDLDSGRMIGLEALLRWRHEGRLVPPGEFIPLAEQSGLIVPIGEWVLREACSQLAAWRVARAVADDVQVSVNVAARQLSDPELPRTIATALRAAALDPSALCLEVTESAIIQQADVAVANLSAIKQQGVSIALDDFGIGFSSLSQIRDLPPINAIKVDRSFVSGLARNDSDKAVVTAIVGLARALGLTVVAEGIETEDQLQLLRSLDCDVGQGFYLAKPQPPEQIALMLVETSLPTSMATAK